MIPFIATFLISGFAVSILFLIASLSTKPKASHRYQPGTHVVISGGSKGIGKSLARKFAELGASVTIIARDEKDLKIAKQEIESARKNPSVQSVKTISLDLIKLDPDKNPKKLREDILGDHETCDILVNCCGSSIPAKFEDTTIQQFRYMMDVNYFSAVNLTKLLLPIMKANSPALQPPNTKQSNSDSRIVFVSSMCGLLSFYGYSGYSASKFALVGLAEALSMELRPFGIGVTVSFPPDTETPGYEEENKIKPKLTVEMSKAGTVYSADQVANSILLDIKSGKFTSTVGIENELIVMSSNAFMPTCAIRALMEATLAGPIKLVGFVILNSWNKIMDAAKSIEIEDSKNKIKSS